MFLKFLLNFLKAPLANLVNELKTNRDANIAQIESTAGVSAHSAESLVTNFLANEAKKNPELAFIVPLAEPELLAVVSGLVAQGTNTVPELYDAGVAFLAHEESVI